MQKILLKNVGVAGSLNIFKKSYCFDTYFCPVSEQYAWEYMCVKKQ